MIVNLSEETKDKNNIPAKSTIITMIILIFIFISYISLILISLSPAEIEHYNTNVIYALADKLYGGKFALLAIAVVLLSTIGTIETQILQFSRTLFAQSREGIFHHRYSKIHNK
ncbi:MAG: amino acid permease [Candidatus Pacebacteria bacterium]|nr:amino acid permease [Candidatus Paceibacterota bacterium]